MILQRILFLVCCLVFMQTFSQEEDVETIQFPEDKKYFEDQFYVGLTYNVLSGKPEAMSQNSLSYGLQAGFIKDIPISLHRDIAIGVGVGYATDSYYHNLKATQTGSTISYNIISGDTNFNTNKFELHAIEFPLEFRWRTSTPATYKFWRIYAGMRFRYNFSAISKYEGDGGNVKFINDDIEDFQYGLTLSFGYNTWNIHVYYGLNDFLKNASILTTNEAITMNALRVGLLFYIL